MMISILDVLKYDDHSMHANHHVVDCGPGRVTAIFDPDGDELKIEGLQVDISFKHVISWSMSARQVIGR